MAPETSKIVTISERKSREAARRAEAARAVIERLRGFVRETGNRGRFIVFGSVANDETRRFRNLAVRNYERFRADQAAATVAAARIIVERFAAELAHFRRIIDGD